MERFDVCIICALAEEADAFIKVVAQKSGAHFERKYSSIQQRDYFHTTILNANGENLKILVTWQARMGILDAGSTFEKLLQEFDTRFIAMTGFCAGNPKHVKMGDIIVAEKTFIYDSGSIIINKAGQRELLRSTTSFQTRNDVLHIIRFFDEWKKAIIQYQAERPISKRQQRDWLLNQLFEKQTTMYDLDKKELTRNAPNWKEILTELQKGEQPLINKETGGLNDLTAYKRFIFELDGFPYQDATEPTTCYIGALATGGAVRRDEPFEEIEQVESKILGVDMEATAIYYALQDRHLIRALVVKGVSDYADGNKDDRYHPYAATLSAAYVATFITQFVNDQYMPWPNKPQNATPIPTPIAQSATPSPQTPKASSTTSTAETTKPPVKIVFSYSESEDDQRLIKKFTNHLAMLKRLKPPLIEIWDRHHIEAGNSANDEIRNKLAEAQIILLMMSPDYYSSDFYIEEIQLIEQCRSNGAQVIPILLRQTDDSWKDAEFYGGLLPLPRNNKPVNSWSDKDLPLSEIAKEIRKAAEKIQNS